ncbi:MAG: glycosyltransferase family 4 protein [Candidatus Diapherotrites archaeon]
MNVAIVSPYAAPEKGACVIRVSSFREYFYSKGHQVKIFAPLRGGNVKEVSGVKRYKSVGELIKLINKNFDLVIGTSPPMTNSFFALIKCKILGIPFVLDVRDPWTYAVESLKLHSKKSIKLKLFKTIEFFCYKFSNKIFVVSDFLKNFIVDNGVPAGKVMIISNGSDPVMVKKSNPERKKIRKKLEIKPYDKVLIYAGTAGGKELDEILLSLKDLIKEFNLHLIFILSSDLSKENEKKLREIVLLVKSLGIKNNFHLIKSVDYNKIYKYFSAADIGLNPLPNLMEYCLPAKTYDYMAAGLPIMAKGPKNGALHNFFKEYKVGYFAVSWNEFKLKLKKSLKNYKKFKVKGINGRKLVIQMFSRKKASELALNELIRLVK